MGKILALTGVTGKKSGGVLTENIANHISDVKEHFTDGISNNGSNHLLCTTIEKMLERGHSVDLIEAVSVRDNTDYPPQLEKPIFKCHTVELKPTQKTNFIGRYLYGLSFVRGATKLAKDLDVDLFFVQSVPTVSFTIRRLKKIGKPIVYNIHDVFPGSAYELGIVKNKLLDKILKRIQRIGFKLADRVVVVSDDMRDVLLKEKTDPNKIFIVNTWYDSDSVRYIAPEDNTFVKEFNIDTSKLIIQYVLFLLLSNKIGTKKVVFSGAIIVLLLFSALSTASKKCLIASAILIIVFI